MTTYRTNNPIGSKDPRDLHDNAENLDVFINDKTKTHEKDRLGVERRTWHGIEQKAEIDIAAAVAEATADAEHYRDQALDAKNAAQTAAMVSGFSKFAENLAELELGIGTEYVDGDVVIVFEDESRNDSSSIYMVESGEAVFKSAFDKTREDLLSFTGNIVADADWSDVPAHTDSTLDVQAQALANRTEMLAQEVVQITQPSGDDAIGGFATFSQLASYSGPATRIEVLDAQRGGVFVRRGSRADDRWITCGKDALGRSWEREAYRGDFSIELDWAPVVFDNSTDNSEVIQYIFDNFNLINVQRPANVFIASPVYVRQPVTFRAQIAGETGASFAFTTANNDGILIEARSVVFENVVVKGKNGTAEESGKWQPVATSGRGWVIGGAGASKNAQGCKLRNCWAIAVGGNGFELIQCNNGEFDVAATYNRGDGWVSNPSVELNFSGNRINVFNSYGNMGCGVVVMGESNQVVAISQSNVGYNVELRSLFNSIIQGYTEFSDAGEMYISANSSGNLIVGTLRPSQGKKDIIRDAQAEENPGRANWILTNSDDYSGTNETNFYIPRLRLESFYTLPKNPKFGELLYTSLSGYDLPYRSLRFLDRVAGWREFAFHDSVGSKTLSSTTAARPTDVTVGDSVFDTTLGKPVWVKSAERPTVYVGFNASTVAANLTITLPSGVNVISIPAGLSTGKLVADFVWQKIMETPALAANLKVNRQGAVADTQALEISYNSCIVADSGNFAVSSSVGDLIAVNTVMSYGVLPVWVDASGTTV